MKNKFFIVLALFSIVLTSCKNENAKKEEATQPTETKTKNFRITLNAIVKKDDNFQIYYKEDNNATTPFAEESSLYVGLKGSESAQDIVFNLPNGVFPTQIRFDFGTNKEQSEIVINDFKMEYEGKTFDAKGASFFNYFRPDETFVKIDKLGGKVTPLISKDGNYDPMFFSMETLDKEIMKLGV